MLFVGTVLNELVVDRFTVINGEFGVAASNLNNAGLVPLVFAKYQGRGFIFNGKPFALSF